MSGCVTELHVTFGGIMAPNRFHRVVTNNHQSADVNKGKGTPAYLWVKRGSGDPVSDVQVLYDDEPVPEGYKKFPKDLSRGQRVYVCYQRAPETDTARGVSEFLILYSDEEPEGEGWEKASKSLNREEPVWLWMRRRGDEDSDDDAWSPAKLQVGDWFDCQDRLGTWMMAQVVAKLPDEELKIRFKGYGSRWDQTIKLSETHRMGPLGSHDAAAGPRKVVLGAPWELAVEDLEEYESQLEAMMRGNMSQEDRDSFSKTLLPAFVERNMRCKHTGTASIDRVNEFFQRVLPLIVYHIRQPVPLTPQVTFMWEQLCLGDAAASYFFNRTGTVLPDTPEAEACNGPFSRVPSGKASPHFVSNMNRFGELGGYDAIIERIENEDPRISLKELYLFTRLLMLAKWCYTRKFRVPYFKRLRNAVYKRLEALTDEELQELDQQLVDNLYAVLLKLLYVVLDEEDVDEMMELLQLALVKRYIQCPYIVKRIRGLTMLLQTIENVTLSHMKIPHGGQDDGDTVQTWITTKYLADWLVENKIVDLLLGNEVDGKSFEVHVELVKRLPDLFKFLARAGHVTTEHLERVWDITADAGDAMLRAVYTMLGKLATRVKLEQLDALWARAATIPNERLDDVALAFVKQFTARAMIVAARMDADRTFGLTLLWDVMQEGGERSLSEQLRKTACEHLTDLLRQVQCRHYALHYLEQCVANLKAGTTVCPSLQLVQNWVSSQPVYPSNEAGVAGETRQDVLDYLEEGHSVIDALTADILRYMNAAAEAADELRAEGSATESLTFADTTLVGCLSHTNQLRRRLDFLRFFLNNSAAELSYDQVKSLWMAFTSSRVDAKSDVSLFLDWLNKAMFGDGREYSSSTCVAFNNRVATDLFQELLCNATAMNHYRDLSLAGYHCFESFFRYINGRLGTMQQQTSRLRFRVADPNLVGIDSLWAIVLNAPADVADAALQFLVPLQVRLSPQVDKRQQWDRFVAHCMDLIAAAADGLRGEGDAAVAADGVSEEEVLTRLERTVEVVLRALTRFLAQVEKSGPRLGGTAGIKARPLQLQVSREAVGEVSPFTYRNASTLPIGEIRNAVANNYRVVPGCVQIRSQEGELLRPSECDQLSVYELNIPRVLYVAVLERPESGGDDGEAPMSLEELAEERRYPRDRLSNSDEYFELLFQLLSLDNAAIVREVWDLIQNLPTNEAIRRSIKTFGGVLPPSPRRPAFRRAASGGSMSADDASAGKPTAADPPAPPSSPSRAMVIGAGGERPVEWDRLLDSRAVLKLLYSLEIVNHLVRPDNEAELTPQQREATQAWCDKFVRLGGFAHLHHVLMNADLGALLVDTLSTSCLELLLRLIYFFMVVPREYQHVQTTKELPADMAMDYNTLITRLLEIVMRTTRAAEAAGTSATAVQEAAAQAAAQAAAAGDGAGGNAAAIAAASAAAASTVESDIVRSCWGLLLAVLRQRPELAAAVYEHDGVADAVVFALMHTSEQPVRLEMQRGILNLCKHITATGATSGAGAGAGAAGEGSGAGGAAPVPPRLFFLPMLAGALDQVYQHEATCSEYFDTLNTLVRVPPPPPPARRALPPRVPSGAGGDAAAPPPVPDAGRPAPAAVVERDVGESFDLESLVTRVTSMIRDHEVRERTPSDLDMVLTGLLRLMCSVLHRRVALKTIVAEAGLVQEVFGNCLFASPNPDARGKPSPPKCKSRITRKSALSLLAELTFGCPTNAETVLSLVMPHHGPAPAPGAAATSHSSRLAALTAGLGISGWGEVDMGELAGRSSTGYCGLKNPGMVCYMNSSMQQFFGVPGFRREVLAYNEPEDDESLSVVHHMQRMFAFLQESERRYYKPNEFALSVKDMGEATNLMVQKDASEFLTNMFQQVEETLSGTRQEKVVRRYFGGTLSAELLAEGGHYSEREEPFYFLSVPVKNKRNLQESLLAYIAGEMVDYKWEEPDGTKKQLNTTKRTSVKDLPPHLIIHLKRFEFDFDLMQQVKLNSAFAFPMELDMKPYSRSGRADAVKRPAEGKASDDDGSGAGGGGGGDEEKKGDADASAGEGADAAAAGAGETEHPDEYYKYELMGVVVHTGTMEMGHYYSYIRERDAFFRPDTGEQLDTRRWMEFNDDSVTPWDPADMEMDCFGGSATNAFLLVYDRVGSAVSTQAAVDPVDADVSTVEARQRRAMQANRAMLPPPLFTEIWNDNLKFRHRQHIFNADYFNFVYNLVTGSRQNAVKALPPAEELDRATDTGALEELGGLGVQLARLGLSFVLNTLTQASDRSALGTWTERLTSLFASNHVAAVWLLQTLMANPAALKACLVEAPHAEVRVLFCTVISYVLGVLSPRQRDSFLTGSDGEDEVVADEVTGDDADAADGEDAPGAADAPVTDDPVADKADDKAAAQGAGTGAGAGATKTEAAATPKAAKASKWVFGRPGSPRACVHPNSKVVKRFVVFLLDMLPEMVTRSSTWSAYFQCLANFASLSPAESAFLRSQNAVTRLVDFVLGPFSPLVAPHGEGDDPHEELRNARIRIRARQPSRPALTPFFTLVNALVTECRPPVESLDSVPPHMLPAGVRDIDEAGVVAVLDAAPELDEGDMLMLCCQPFCRTIVDQLASSKVVKTIKPLLTHLVWENAKMSEQFVAIVEDGVCKGSLQLKPYFRAVALLCNVPDHLQVARTRVMLEALLEAMAQASNYYVPTEKAIELLTKLCKRNPTVKAWLAANPRKAVWCVEWLHVNPLPPTDRRGPVSLFPPGAEPRGRFSAASLLRSDNLAPNMLRALEGKELVQDGYDSDDEPAALVGMRVAVRWSGGKWYAGLVDQYNDVTGEHHITYDDNDHKWYNMGAKVFRVLGPHLRAGFRDDDGDAGSSLSSGTATASVSDGSASSGDEGDVAPQPAPADAAPPA